MANKSQLAQARRKLRSPNKKTHRRALKLIKAAKRQRAGLPA
ncbi:MAG: putative metal homeostasis protein [Sporolactobacillus sp.]